MTDEPSRSGPAPAVGGAVGALVGVLAQEPTTGVSILGMDGMLVWANDQAARLFFGEQARAADYVGKPMSAFFEKAVAEDRLRLFHEQVTKGPVLLRNIRQGHQIVSWMQFIEPETPEGRGQVLVVTRRQPGDVAGTLLVDGPYKVEESRFVHLGPLDVLTPRELEVLALLGQGMSVKEIARLLHRSEKTVETHRASIGRKLKVDDRVILAEIARRAGISVADAERTRV